MQITEMPVTRFTLSSMSSTHGVRGNHSKSWREREVRGFIPVGLSRLSNLLLDPTSRLVHRLLSQQCTKNHEFHKMYIQLMSSFILSMSGIFGRVHDLGWERADS